jgi:biopolymer transport protein ExbB/TolQ
MSNASRGTSLAHPANAVTVPLVVSALFALGALIGLLALVELQPVKEQLGITDNLLDRFPHNILIKIQVLMFLIGIFYLLVRTLFARRVRDEIEKRLKNERKTLMIEGASADSKEAAMKRIDALVARAEAAENASLAPLSFVVWVLPILGFLGTVVGVSNSMGPLEALAKGESAAKVAPDLLRNLRYPFDATFTGLVLLLPMMAFFTVAATRAKRRVVDLRADALGLSRGALDEPGTGR